MEHCHSHPEWWYLQRSMSCVDSWTQAVHRWPKHLTGSFSEFLDQWLCMFWHTSRRQSDQNYFRVFSRHFYLTLNGLSFGMMSKNEMPFGAMSASEALMDPTIFDRNVGDTPKSSSKSKVYNSSENFGRQSLMSWRWISTTAVDDLELFPWSLAVTCSYPCNYQVESSEIK